MLGRTGNRKLAHCESSGKIFNSSPTKKCLYTFHLIEDIHWWENQEFTLLCFFFFKKHGTIKYVSRSLKIIWSTTLILFMKVVPRGNYLLSQSIVNFLMVKLLLSARSILFLMLHKLPLMCVCVCRCVSFNIYTVVFSLSFFFGGGRRDILTDISKIKFPSVLFQNE